MKRDTEVCINCGEPLTVEEIDNGGWCFSCDGVEASEYD